MPVVGYLELSYYLDIIDKGRFTDRLAFLIEHLVYCLGYVFTTPSEELVKGLGWD